MSTDAEEVNSCFRRFTELFLYGASQRDFPWDEISSDLDEEHQKILLLRTVLHPVSLKYPPSFQSQRNFCKKLMQKVEEKGFDVCEELYESYVKLLPPDSSTYCYKSYCIPMKSDFVSILESKNLLSCGTTGLTTWYGALALAEWCANNSTIFYGMKVLELGCGTGFTGIMTLKLCEPLLYVFSDYNGHVLSLLKQNLKLNLGQNKLEFPQEIVPDFSGLEITHGNTKIESRNLDWTEQSTVDDIFKDFGSFDIILAADVVFDPSILPDLVQTLKNVLRNSSCDAFACFSLTVRNPETFQLFLDELLKNCLKWEQMPLNLPQIFHFDRSWDVRILIIKAALGQMTS